MMAKTVLALVFGIVSPLLWMDQVPNMGWVTILSFTIALLAIYSAKKIRYLVVVYIFGFWWVLLSVTWVKAHQLPEPLEGQRLTITGYIASIPQNQKNMNHTTKVQFTFKANAVGLVRLTWYHPPKKLQVGDKWQLSVTLKRPWGLSNPGSYNSEKSAFQKRISAIGTIHSQGQNQCLASKWWEYPVDRLRQRLYESITDTLQGRKLQGLVLALVLGERHEILTDNWRDLQHAGIGHLVAISGLHIGLAAGFFFFLAKQILMTSHAASIAIAVAVAYASLSGWAISTQRAVIMTFFCFAQILWRRKISRWHAYWLSALLILLWDPLVVLSMGFWLSFAACGWLLYGATDDRNLFGLWPQVILWLGLSPLLSLFVGKLTYISPIINCFAIPYVSLFIMPVLLLALFFLLICPIVGKNLLNLGCYGLEIFWHGVTWILEFFQQSGTEYINYNFLTFFLSSLGAVWVLAPRYFPSRWIGIFCCLSLCFTKASSSTIEWGQAELSILDVGQGLAIVIRTKKHILLYDAGPKWGDYDIGEQVVIPFLQHHHVNFIDKIIISHRDMDHSGGLLTLLNHYQIEDLTMDEPPTGLPMVGVVAELCRAGKTWWWDGVLFEIIYPFANEPKPTVNNQYKKPNELSCCLQITVGNQRVLLTGDIGIKTEKKLLANEQLSLQSDLLIVPHHGSRYSSSEHFIAAIEPKFAIIAAGRFNRYHHPSQEVLQRYDKFGSLVLTTWQTGALTFKLDGKDRNVKPNCYRIKNHKLWNTDVGETKQTAICMGNLY